MSWFKDIPLLWTRAETRRAHELLAGAMPRWGQIVQLAKEAGLLEAQLRPGRSASEGLRNTLDDAAAAGLLGTLLDRFLEKNEFRGVHPLLKATFAPGPPACVVAPYHALTPGPDAPGFRLLLSRHGIVPMAGREALLREFRDWCEGGGLRVRLITGQAGQGKSRFLRELCRLQSEGKWTAGLLKRGTVEQACAVVAEGRPCLFGLDSAETWGDELVSLLGALHTVAKDDAPLRVVLIARTAAEWWDALPARLTEVEALDPDDLVIPLREPDEDVTEMWKTAVAAFSKARGRDGIPAAPTPALELLKEWLGQGLLVLHIAAMLASEGELPIGGRSEVRLVDHLVEREMVLWRAVAMTRIGNLPNLDMVLLKAAAVGTLAGRLEGQSVARDFLVGIPGLSGIQPHVLDGIARVFRELYPDVHDAHLALPPIRPDLVGERIVERVAASDQTVVLALFAPQEPLYAECATRVLGRVATRRGGAALSALVSAAQARTATALRAWLTVAQTEAWSIALARAIEKAFGELHQLEPDEAFLLCGTIPSGSLVLSGISVALATRACGNGLRAEQAFSEETAKRAHKLVLCKVANGDKQAALQMQRRVLAALDEGSADDRECRRALASALTTMVALLIDTGDANEIKSVAKRAVSFNREYSEEGGPGLENYSTSLGNLATAHLRLKSYKKAISASRRAIKIRAIVASEDPPRYEAGFAHCCHNLGGLLGEAGASLLSNAATATDGRKLLREAWTYVSRSVEIRERLFEARPDLYQARLASSLTGRARWYGTVGRGPDALADVERALALWRPLFELRPAAVGVEMANTLFVRAKALAAAGKAEASRTAAEEARSLLSKFSADGPAFREFRSVVGGLADGTE